MFEDKFFILKKKKKNDFLTKTGRGRLLLSYTGVKILDQGDFLTLPGCVQ